MILDLDHRECLDPGRVGSKAAWLAMGRRAGLPVLPGLVVEAGASRHHMRVGAETLATRGSGGARLAVTAETIPFDDELVGRVSELGDRLVARSSTMLEASGEWSGAFTSYLDLTPTDVPKAVAGCWASAFSVAALERQVAASVEPGSFPMSVLIQRALDPVAGGTARVENDGTVVVHGVKGSPAPLLQGWSTGHEARVSPPSERSEHFSPQRVQRALGGVPPEAGRGVSGGERRRRGGGYGQWVGDELIELLDVPTLDKIAVLVQRAKESLGANRFEWAVDGEVWLLQIDADNEVASSAPPPPPADLVDPDLVRIARVVTRAPGRLGEELILPWALAGLPRSGPVTGERPADALALARELRNQLTAEVWAMPAEDALYAAGECMAGLLGPDPLPALDRIRRLRSPDPARSARLLSLVDGLRPDVVEPRTRLGVGRWEPFVASVVLATGDRHHGMAASAGIGAGLRSQVDHPRDMGSFSPRDVVTSPQPIPNLAPLLWEAAGLVTETGSPAAHLFESARAIGVPAVCGVDLPVGGEEVVAVDGHSGVVSILSLYGEDDV